MIKRKADALKQTEILHVDLPHQFDVSTMYSFIDNAIDRNYLPRNNNIVINFNTLKFIRPSGVTILSNIVQWLLTKGVKVSFRWPDNFNYTSHPIKFLDDSNFFNIFLKRKLSESSEPRSTTIPLKLVKYEESYSWIEERLIFWLMQGLSLNKGSLSNIKVCFAEIFNNIKDHSMHDIGCVFGQHFPAENSVKIAISDFGVGIPYNVKNVLPNLSDSQSILKAIEEGFTTKSSRRNAGAGLDILIHNIVLNNKGTLSIYSNCGAIECKYNNGAILKNIIYSHGIFPGTLIYADLRTDTFVQEEDYCEEFEW